MKKPNEPQPHRTSDRAGRPNLRNYNPDEVAVRRIVDNYDPGHVITKNLDLAQQQKRSQPNATHAEDAAARKANRSARQPGE
jgi:hypothetical protein